MNWVSFLAILCFKFYIFENCDCNQEYELQYIQILLRHGDTSPNELYPTDPNPESFWRVGLGSLTSLGRRQESMVGKVFRRKYKDFISSNPSEISIRSSEYDRCIKSAEAYVTSFYALNTNRKFEADVNWQPLPIYYLPKDEDKYLDTKSYCPEADNEEKRIVMSPEGQQFIKENSHMFHKLTKYSGTPITNWTSAFSLYDTLSIERTYNLAIPYWADLYWEQLHNVATLSFYWRFKSHLLRRLRAGPLIGLIVDNMKKKISGEIDGQKVQLYTSHEKNVAVVLQALGVYNMKEPPYSAAVVFELYKSKEEYSVRLLYFNSSTPEQGDQSPNILTMPGCTEYCPLEFFVDYTKDYIPEDWKEECNL